MTTQLIRYIDQKWGNQTPLPELLKLLGYLSDEGYNNDGRLYQLTQNAFALIVETPPIPVFISYRNQESAAFALLTLERRLGSSPHALLESLRRGRARQV